jgi:hypothetical protein
MIFSAAVKVTRFAQGSTLPARWAAVAILIFRNCPSASGATQRFEEKQGLERTST